MAKKVLVHVSIHPEIFSLMGELRSKGLKDGDLHYFKFALSTKNAWYNYILQMGVNKIREDFERWKTFQIKDKEDKDKEHGT